MTAGEWKKQLSIWKTNGTLEILLPEVAALQGVKQPVEYHPEGDAFTHTMLAVAKVADDDDPRVFWAVLLHDIGKSLTTTWHDGRWRAHGHDQAGAGMVSAILNRFDLQQFADDVEWLVKHHQYQLSWNLRPGAALTRRQERFTQHTLFPFLQRVCAADATGR